MTNTDMSIDCERKKIAAPVIITLAKPSSSGSAAAASEPKTPSRISSTIGKPVASAVSRSSLLRSCMPAQSAVWPTRYGFTSSTAAVPRSSRRSTARSAISSASPSRRSGSTRIVSRPASRLAAAAAAGVSVACGRSAAIAATRSTWPRRPAGVAPGWRASTTARLWRCAPSKRSTARSTASELEPGTTKPPAVRCSVWRAAKGTAATSTSSHAAEHEPPATLYECS